MDRSYPAHNVTKELADVEDAARKRAPSASFRRFDVLFIATGLAAWIGYVVWSWWL